MPVSRLNPLLRFTVPTVLIALVLAAGLLAVRDAGAGPPNPHRDAAIQRALDHLNPRARAWGLRNQAPPGDATPLVADNFEVLGHNSLGSAPGSFSNGDVWVHGNFAYVGSIDCGRGVKIIDVSDLQAPRVIGTVASVKGENAEDVVVRHVETDWFRGDLLAAGMQGRFRCFSEHSRAPVEVGVQLWDVTDPRHPRRLSTFGVSDGVGDVHELDLFQRGDNVYALLAVPFSEWFNFPLGGELRIIDVTDPRRPVQVGEFGAHAAGLSTGPFSGMGSDPAILAHGARASADGTKAYVSYWDLGVLTLDISDVTKPTLIGRTRYPAGAEGEAHSVAEYESANGLLLLQNDEDFDPLSPARILYGPGPTAGVGLEASITSLFSLPGHTLTADVVQAANHGCFIEDYPADTPGKIAVVRFEVDLWFAELPPCSPFPSEQAAAAEAAGAAAVVFDFISATGDSPFAFAFHVGAIPALYTDHTIAQGMVTAGSATLEAQEPTWGFLRVFDGESDEQVAKFDAAPNVHAGFESPPGAWSVHNTEVAGDRGYSAWYSNGVVALDLSPLDGSTPGDPVMVGQFVPPGQTILPPPGEPGEPFVEPALVWGVAIREDGVVFVSDIFSGLWIVRPTGDAAPSD